MNVSDYVWLNNQDFLVPLEWLVSSTRCTGQQLHAHRSCVDLPWWRCRSPQWRWGRTWWSSGTRAESPATRREIKCDEWFIQNQRQNLNLTASYLTVNCLSVLCVHILFIPCVSSQHCSAWSSGAEWEEARWRWRWTETACCWHK